MNEEQSILNSNQEGSNYLNDLAMAVFINGESLEKYEKVVTKQYGEEVYNNMKMFVEEVQGYVKRKSFTNTSKMNIGYLGKNAGLNEQTINSIIQHYEDQFDKETSNENVSGKNIPAAFMDNDKESDSNEQKETNGFVSSGWLKGLLAAMTLLTILFLVLFISANNQNKELQKEIASLNSDSKATNALVQNKDKEISQLKGELNTLKSEITSVAPFVIYKVEIGNTYKNGPMETEYGGTIYDSNTMFLKPKVYYKGFLEGDYNLKIKWFKPDGSMSTGSSSPNSCSQAQDCHFSEGDKSIILDGWGNDDKGHWGSGDYQLEIWYQDKCVYVKNFRIYD